MTRGLSMRDFDSLIRYRTDLITNKGIPPNNPRIKDIETQLHEIAFPLLRALPDKDSRIEHLGVNDLSDRWLRFYAKSELHRQILSKVNKILNSI